MTASQFRAWLAAMHAAGHIRAENCGMDRDAGALLGVSPHTVVHMKREGVTGATAARTALACRALLHRLEPYA